MKQKFPKVAIVYDRVNTKFGGAEIVIKAISEIFPNAPLFTSVYHKNKANWAKNINVFPSFLQRIPFLQNKHQFLLPLMPLAFESFDLSKFDLIISVTSAEAKGIITKPNQTHICYMLTPPRYIYSHQSSYTNSRWYFKLPLINNLMKLLFKYIETWDKSACYKPDIIIPISKLVAKRIKKTYHLKPEKVIYPPVSKNVNWDEIKQIPLFKDTNKFFLSVSRLVNYKKVDISIKTCVKLKKPLVVVGDGMMKNQLHNLAGIHKCIKKPDESLESFLKRATIENKIVLFTGTLSKKDVNKLFRNCEALLMPGEEDFGITALEAGIFGKPVIIFYTSGVSELLKDNLHAIHIKEESISEMIFALGKLESISFNAKELHFNALKYDVNRFKQEFEKKVKQELKGNYVIS